MQLSQKEKIAIFKALDGRGGTRDEGKKQAKSSSLLAPDS